MLSVVLHGRFILSYMARASYKTSYASQRYYLMSLENLIQNMDKTDILGQCPDENAWERRKNQFRTFEAMAIGNGEYGQKVHDQREPLLLELEHCYCSGAWLSTVLLSQAIIEISMAFHGLIDWKSREAFLEKYNLHIQAKNLRLYRNSLVHRSQNQPAVITMEKILFYRQELKTEAKRSVFTALQVTLLGLKYYDPYNS